MGRTKSDVPGPLCHSRRGRRWKPGAAFVMLSSVATAAGAQQSAPLPARATEAAEAAQQDAQEAATAAGDIVVTARRRSESLQTVPVTLSAFGEA